MANSKKAEQKQEERLDEIYGIALITTGLLLAFSVFTSASGLVGRYAVLVLRLLVGGGRFIIPFAVAAWGVAFIAKRPKIPVASVGAGLLICFLSLISIFHLRVPAAVQFSDRSLAAYGGIFGAAFAYVLRTLFANVGAYVVLVAAFITGMIVATGVSLGETLARAYQGLMARGEEVNRRTQSRRKTKQSALRDDEPTVRVAPPVAVPALEEVVGKNTGQLVATKTTQLTVDIDNELAGAVGYQLPPVELLKRTSGSKLQAKKGVKENSEAIERTLSDFEVDASVTRVIKGPTVTRYELRLASGVKVNRVLSLADDIALALATADVRILAPIPGKSAIGIEVPNQYRELVTLGDILCSSEAKETEGVLNVGIGKDITGQAVLTDIGDMPHLLIAGATGSGKSVCLNTILVSLLTRARPDQLKMILIDPKRIELNLFVDIPHLLTPVVTNVKQAATVLTWAVGEMEDRFQVLSEVGVRNIDSYNKAVEKDGELQTMPYVVVVIDELADLMMVAPSEVEDTICRIAQLARAVGIHLIVATQRPSTDIITGLIKANITCRIAFSVSSQIDSRVILDAPGAEKLVGKGDMLFQTPAMSRPQRLQGAYVTEQEIEVITSYVKKQQKPDYRPEILEEAQGKFGYDFDDPLIGDAMRVVVNAGQASVSMLQRRLRVGYSRAARLVDMLEAKGIVGPYEGSRPRAVLLTPDELDRLVEDEE